jgi:hypothetical protein
MKFNLPALSYGRGFLRFYAVLTVGWIIALLIALPSYRLRVWVAPRPDAFLADFASRRQDYISLGKRIKASAPGDYDDLDDYVIGVLTAAKYPDALRQRDWFERHPPPPGPLPQRSGEPPIINSPPLSADVPSFAQSRIGRSLWLLGLLLGLPAVGYFGLFCVVPWVYRGFKPRVLDRQN